MGKFLLFSEQIWMALLIIEEKKKKDEKTCKYKIFHAIYIRKKFIGGSITKGNFLL